MMMVVMIIVVMMMVVMMMVVTVMMMMVMKIVVMMMMIITCISGGASGTITTPSPTESLQSPTLVQRLTTGRYFVYGFIISPLNRICVFPRGMSTNSKANGSPRHF